ncbi:sugar ABC transporter ATP-binding protein [Caproiciproducens galactitolivorans]|uniref:Sugar ABC transporter ATP-binding protein n=1 Tax=Caproiciproducens galactitolivorans TaxID=642589 RepID=A0ABT4BXW1_9FIRM|nr:sugar ABC transporter ATP-binding protein [Caproiciproducens galactitolivorans]MCY1715165.1 sugar ABC transporter ATP-binding protein [Caproiciproducens galactitolivorans]
MSDSDYVLQLQHIRKTYPGVVALNDVSLEVKKGEIHALVGENGAGKSTLIKTCSGAVVPDSGKIIINDKEFDSMTPQLSMKNGIAVIYQEFNLVGGLSVAENVFLGRSIRKGIVIDKKAMIRETEKIFKTLNISIDPNMLVRNLSVGYQQMVEIAKAIQQDAKILIMDEPSAPLTKAEVSTMFEIIDKLKESGVSIIYISHRLDEIFRLSDRVTVLRDGTYIKTLATQDTDVDELISLMVGRELTEKFPVRENCIRDDVVLEVRNLSGNGDKNISFSIRKGEILGLGGLVGAGRTELAQMIFGAAQKTDGTIFLNGKEISPKSPRDAIDLGIALVPEDRKSQGVLLGLSIKKNINMPIYKRISKFSVINRKNENDVAEEYMKDIRIKAPSSQQLVKNLSGGNQQKVILGKWLAANSELIIFDEPTRGIDVGAKYEIYKLMNELVENGKTILLISSEMEELMGMSDRIIVLSEGKMTGEIEKENFNQENIMSYASTVKEE